MGVARNFWRLGPLGFSCLGRGVGGRVRRVDVRAGVARSVVAAVLSLAAPCSLFAQSACDADIDADGIVGPADLSGLLVAWGACAKCSADIDRDGTVGSADLSQVLARWGETCITLPWATVLEVAPDPAVVTNAAFRNAIAATGLPWRVRDDGTGIEMLLVPPGSFTMGCSASAAFACDPDEVPVHQVTLTNAFYLGRTEVTQAAWTARMGSNPSLFQGAAYPAAANRPVEQVSWEMIAGSGGFLTGTGLRFPTEAEWEYAYRAGTTTAYHGFAGAPDGTNADALVGSIARFGGNNGASGTPTYGTKAVGQKAANALGFHDMSGNVFEWVADWYAANYCASSPAANPTGPGSGNSRVLRGGAWFFNASGVRASNRNAVPPAFVNSYNGFRVARDP